MRFLLFIGFSLAVCVSTGCTSIRSILLERNECNNGWNKERHLAGVPITLKVPTHLRISVVDKHYLTRQTIGGVTEITRVKMEVPVRDVRHDFLYTEKIFTVDFKRPAAGTIDLNLVFQDDGQYFKEIKDKVVDETIARVTDLVGKLAPGGVFRPASGGGGNLDADLKEIDSVVATEIFEVDDPMFEQRLAAFLDCHVNKSHDAWVVGPDVMGIKRAPLVGDPIDRVLCNPGALHQVPAETMEVPLK